MAQVSEQAMAFQHQQLKRMGEFNQAAAEKKKKNQEELSIFMSLESRDHKLFTRQQRWQISWTFQHRTTQNYELRSFGQTVPQLSLYKQQ